MLRLAIEVGALISADNEELQEKLRKEAERLQEKTKEYNKAKEQAQRRLKKAKQKEKDVQHIMNENTLAFPFLTSLYADYEKTQDERLERYLWTKKNPAPHSAFLVQQIRHEKMAMAKECRANKYRLHLYHTAYPELKEAEKMTPKEAYLYLIAHTSNTNLPKPPEGISDGVSFDTL